MQTTDSASPRASATPACAARLALTCWFVAVAGAAAAQAQPARTVVALPSAFVGAGFGLSTNDAESRMRLFEEKVATALVVEAGAALGARVGIGVEYSQPSAATAFTTVGLGRAQIAGRQEERVVVGLLRGRLAGTEHWALDIVGGAGVLFQHHESGGCVPAVTRCEDTGGLALDERAPAFVVGLDVPVRAARHFELVAALRIHSLRRGEHTSAQDINLSWQYEWRSTTRAAATLNGRLVW